MTTRYDEDFVRLQNNFTYHKPFGDQPERYEGIRAQAKQLAGLMQRFCPPSRELSLAITAIEESVMWANAAIARNETPPVTQSSTESAS